MNRKTLEPKGLKRICILIVFGLQSIAIPLMSAAQEISVSGKVTDESGPLPGVSILVKGTETGTSTDGEGNYSLSNVPSDAILEVSFLGYLSREVPVDGREKIDIRLKPASEELDQVVVVGYGTQEREDVTGAISSISSRSLREVPVTQASESLQGRAAGVYVTNSGNRPGNGATVRIRGNRSFAAGNDPLFVVDGIPITGGLEDINPADIESMEVLKDASATAIYGSRGANGVVIVTTKRGEAGRTVVSYNGYVGMSDALGQVDMMNGPEFAEFKRESRRATGEYTGDEDLFEPVELESIQQGRSTDYQDLMLETGFTQNHQLSVSGGNENTLFNLSFNYFQDNGIIPIQDFERYTTRINVDQQLGERFRIGTSTLGSYSIQDGDDLNPFDDALAENPLGVPYDAEGNLIFLPTQDGLRTNPLNEIVPNAYVNRQKRFRLFSSIYGEAILAEGLKFRLNFGPDLIQRRLGNYAGPLTNARREGPATADGEEDFVFNYTLENILTYNRTFNDIHSLDITGLYSIQSRQFEQSSISVRGIPVESMQHFRFGAAEEILETDSDFEKWTIQSYMARVNYGYDGRYLLTLTARADGSSRFGSSHRFGFFPSVAFGWNIMNEEFMQNSSFFDNLKLRLSYGKTGNTGIDPYQTQGLLERTIYAFGNTPAFGFRPSQLRNDDLKWETTASFNAGLDFSIMESRISGMLEFYQQNTTDLLMERQLPFTSGYGSVLENVGATRNTGFEFTLSTVNIRENEPGGFSWSTDLNFFTNKEEIVELYGGKEDDVGNEWFIGEPIRVFYDYDKIGIWQQDEAEEAAGYNQSPGEIKVKDQNGDGQINDQDRVILGTDRPDFSGGITNRFSYKGFDLSVFVFVNVGNMIESTLHRTHNYLFGRYNNVDVDYWTPDNPTNAYPRPNRNQEFPLYNTSMAYFDGSYVKIRNISLGYNFSQAVARKIGAQSLRIYLSAKQPFIFAPYVRKHKGIDPEYDIEEDEMPVNIPALRTFLLGLNVSF